MVCLKAPTCAERSGMAIVLLFFCRSPGHVILYQPFLLVNLHWHLVDLGIDLKKNGYNLIKTKTSI